jgi:hypothetical protein
MRMRNLFIYFLCLPLICQYCTSKVQTINEDTDSIKVSTIPDTSESNFDSTTAFIEYYKQPIPIRGATFVDSLLNTKLTVEQNHKVIVKLKISQTGTVDSVAIIQGVNSAIDNEIVKIFKNIGFAPATYKGSYVPADIAYIVNIIRDK